MQITSLLTLISTNLNQVGQSNILFWGKALRQRCPLLLYPSQSHAHKTNCAIWYLRLLKINMKLIDKIIYLFCKFNELWELILLNLGLILLD
jgi:hypothetical protein